MADGFLGRWARRKADAREGKPLEEPAVPVAPQVVPTVATMAVAPKDAGVPSASQADPVNAPADPALPTLQDAQALTTDSDFRPFMSRQVAPDVRNAAMKKLFADPHFNVMDRMDVYIDDYGKPDPIPQGMLRQMVGSQLLGLFDHEKDPATRDDADNPTGQSVAQSQSTNGPVVVQEGQPADALPAEPVPDIQDNPTAHANIDLRLQPDHAAGAEEARRGAQ